MDAPIDDSSGPYPLVIFSHGFTLKPEWYAPIPEHYASHVFIVLAPEHVEQFDWEWSEIAPASIERTEWETTYFDNVKLECTKSILLKL